MDKIPFYNDKSSNLIKKTFPLQNKRYTFSGGTAIQKCFPKLNPPVPLLNHTNVVYQISCHPPCPKKYPGQTKRLLSERINEHRRYTDYHQIGKSGISDHAINSGHTPQWNTPRILSHAPTPYGRIIFEQWQREQLGTNALNKINPRHWTDNERILKTN